MDFKKYKTPILLFLLLLLVITATVVVRSQVQFSGDGLEAQSLNKLQDIISIIDIYYVEETGSEELIENAFKGMVGELDDYSHYLTAEEFEEEQFHLEGEYGGIGLRIITYEEQLTIMTPFPDTPGDRAGLQPEDRIMEVDGKPTAEMSQDRAVDMMRGKPGTEVELLIERDDVDDAFPVTITREIIEVPYVEGEMATEEIGHISVTQFINDVGLKVEDEIKQLTAEGARGLILDLRNNPGGLLPEALTVASNFVEEGKLLTEKRRWGEKEHYVNTEVGTTELPVVVLVNQGSASGSEIVAGILQDFERATLVGKTTFGKGSVQTMIPLDDGSAVRLTTANYFLPSGYNISEKGVSPDVEIEIELGELPEESDGLFPEEDFEIEDTQLEKAIELLQEKI